MKLRPLADRVIVKQSEAEEKTTSGIVLPDTAKEKPTKGKVIAVGPGKLDDKGKRMALNVRAGDTVYYGKYSRHRRGSEWREVRHPARDRIFWACWSECELPSASCQSPAIADLATC